MPPKGISRIVTAPRLPPLPKLSVRRPDAGDVNPCVGIMTSMLGCWASSGPANEGCMMLEQQLRACMDTPRPDKPKKNNINFHLGRMYPMIKGPHKKKK